MKPPSIYFYVNSDHVSFWKILYMQSMWVAISALEVSQLFHYSCIGQNIVNITKMKIIIQKYSKW